MQNANNVNQNPSITFLVANVTKILYNKIDIFKDYA